MKMQFKLIFRQISNLKKVRNLQTFKRKFSYTKIKISLLKELIFYKANFQILIKCSVLAKNY